MIDNNIMIERNTRIGTKQLSVWNLDNDENWDMSEWEK